MDAEDRDHKAQDGSKDPDSNKNPDSNKAQTGKKSAAPARPSKEGILPKVASEDEPRSWGDESGYDHDAWLKEQRPPHWG